MPLHGYTSQKKIHYVTILYWALLVIEDYPQAFKGPSILLLQKDKNENPIHTVWGIPKAKDAPAVLITAYIPNPEKWDKTFTKRRLCCRG